MTNGKKKPFWAICDSSGGLLVFQNGHLAIYETCKAATRALKSVCKLYQLTDHIEKAGVVIWPTKH